MASTTNLKVLGLHINQVNYRLSDEDSSQISYDFKKKQLDIDLQYFTGESKQWLFFTHNAKSRIKSTLQQHEYVLELLVSGDEQTKKIKNMGGGALIGAVVAGPVGAAAGAWLGTKRKQLPCKIEIEHLGLTINALAPINLVDIIERDQFFDKK